MPLNKETGPNRTGPAEQSLELWKEFDAAIYLLR